MARGNPGLLSGTAHAGGRGSHSAEEPLHRISAAAAAYSARRDGGLPPSLPKSRANPPTDADLDPGVADRGPTGRRRPHRRLLRAMALEESDTETVHRRGAGRLPDRRATGVLPGLAQSANRAHQWLALSSGGIS